MTDRISQFAKVVRAAISLRSQFFHGIVHHMLKSFVQQMKKAASRRSNRRCKAGKLFRAETVLEVLEVRIVLSGYSPAQIRDYYGINSIPEFQSSSGNVLADGTGQTVAIIDNGNDPNIVSDLNSFDKGFSLTGPVSGNGWISSSGKTVTGIETLFQSQIAPGDLIGNNTSGYYQVASIASSAQSLTLATVPGVSFSVSSFNIIASSVYGPKAGTGTISTSGETVTVSGSLSQFATGDLIGNNTTGYYQVATVNSNSLTLASAPFNAFSRSTFNIVSPTIYQGYGAASSFFNVYNQSDQNITQYISSVTGSNSQTFNGVTVPGVFGVGEISLDVEWVHTIAPGAKIDLIECQGFPYATVASIIQGLPGKVSVVSMSYGGGESSGEAGSDGGFVLPGVTFVAATGDNGAPGEYPAYSPNVLAVGGTGFGVGTAPTPGSAGPFLTGEIAVSGSGGGISQYESEPSYQESVQQSGKRSIPDVAFDFLNVWIYNSNGNPTSGWGWVGGTSLSTPCWSGLLAITNQGRALAGEAPLNSSGPQQTMQALYELGSTIGNPYFNDITQGTNETVQSVTVKAGGTGYVGTMINFSAGGGSGAAATVDTSNGVITGVTINSNGGGTGYHGTHGGTTFPVTFSGSGTGATGAYATVNATGSIVSVTVPNGGSGYLSVDFTGGGGSAKAVAIVGANGKIVGITMTNGGAGYTSPPSVQIDFGGGHGALLQPVMSAGYNAGPGYDEVTGLGSPIANTLIPALVAPLANSLPRSIIVTTSSDSPTASGVSLRDAVNLANEETAAGVSPTITFATNLNGDTITLTQGELSLIGGSGTTTINGAGQITISGNLTSSVFGLDVGAHAVLAGLSIDNGNAGHAGDGGGIFNAGSLTVNNTTFHNDLAEVGGGDGGYGGAIFDFGALTINNSTFSANGAANGGGAIDNAGGGEVANSLTINACTFTNNKTTNGGDGGAINNGGTASVLSISDSTYSANDAYNAGAINNGTGDSLNISNSTIANNSATGFGGGISNSGSLTVANLTLVGNTSGSYGGGFALLYYGTGSINNTIIAGNSAVSAGPDVFLLGGSVATKYSLIGNTGSSGISIGGSSGNINPTGNLGLGPLGNNGGPTQTIALLPGSPAISKGKVSLAVNAHGQALTTDQRGLPRNVNGNVDIGAFQLQPTVDSAPSEFVRPNGEVDIAVQGPNNSLDYYWATPGNAWNVIQIAGSGTTYSAPQLIVRANGEADIVAEGSNNSLMYYHATPGSAWSSNKVAGNGTTFAAPSMFVRANGEADIVADGANNSLMYYHATPGSAWSSGQVAGNGTTFSAPSIFVRSNGEADVVAEGANNSLMYYWATPGSAWSSHQIAGKGSTFSAPSVFVRANGEADIVAEGASNSLTYYWATPGSSWNSHQVAGNGTTFSSPLMLVRADGEADIVAEGANNSLMYYWAAPGGAWNSHQIVGNGTTFSAPSLFVRTNGEADIAAKGANNSLMYYWAASGSTWAIVQV